MSPSIWIVGGKQQIERELNKLWQTRTMAEILFRKKRTMAEINTVLATFRTGEYS